MPGRDCRALATGYPAGAPAAKSSSTARHCRWLAEPGAGATWLTSRLRTSGRLAEMPPEKLGSLIGAVFGLVFVLVNAGPLPSGSASSFGRSGSSSSCSSWSLYGAVTGSPRGPSGSAGGGFGRGYWLVVAAEVVAIVVGVRLLAGPLDTPGRRGGLGRPRRRGALRGAGRRLGPTPLPLARRLALGVRRGRPDPRLRQCPSRPRSRASAVSCPVRCCSRSRSGEPRSAGATATTPGPDHTVGVAE